MATSVLASFEASADGTASADQQAATSRRVSRPADLGWLAEKLREAETCAASIGSTAVQVVWRDQVVLDWDFNALGTIFEQRTGHGIPQEFKARIADKIGMEDFTLNHTLYLREYLSIHPAYRFSLSARDLAKFGQLCLNRGRWNGEQLIPEAWIEESTRRHSDAMGGIGYGYMWWVGLRSAASISDALPSALTAAMQEETVVAIGGRGQRLYVVPPLETVIVHLYRATGEGDLGVPRPQLGTLLRTVLTAHPSSSG